MRPLARAALFAAALLAADASALDCRDCAPGKVCTAHDAADDMAIKEAGVLLRDPDPLKRSEGIDKLAQAALVHENARSKKLTNELLKILADPEAGVKRKAAEKLGALGDEAMAVQALSREVGNATKAAGGGKPKKDDELKKWEAAIATLGAMTAALCATKSAQAVAPVEKAVKDASPFVAKAAADNCYALKGRKELMKALMDSMRKWSGAKQAEGVTDAFFASARAMKEVCGDEKAPKWESKQTRALMLEWEDWWKENEKKLK
jgi:hypothetical protein